jgi:hypothetical protein
MAPKKRRDLALEPVMLTGIALSLVLSITLYFVTTTSIVLGIALCILGIALTLQLEILMRLERKVRKEDKQSQLISLMEHVPWLSDEVREIAVYLNSISAIEQGDGYLLEVARKSLDECGRTLSDLTRGQIRVSNEDNEALFAQTVKAKEYILATSVPHVDLKWWSSDIGRKYWEANLAALKRGVRIERIFIHQEWTDELRDLALQQARAGIVVWSVPRDKIPQGLRIDMIVWDQSFSYEIVLNSDGEEIANLYSVNSSEISRKLHIFEIIRSCAGRVFPPGADDSAGPQPLQLVRTREADVI